MNSPMLTSPCIRREKCSIASQLEGVLLVSRNTFPYFMLIALEAGGPLRALGLLLVSPVLWFLELVGSDDTALRTMIFVSTVGLKVADVKAVAKATLPKFFLEDFRESAYKLLSSYDGGDKYVVTSILRIMVEPFLREYLDVDHVIGTELQTTVGGYCTGLVASKGVMGGVRVLEAVRGAMGDDGDEIDVGLVGGGVRNHPLMLLCKETHIIPPEDDRVLPRRSYPKPLIFHDGRLVMRPTPLTAFALLLWLPASIFLAIFRILVGVLLPYKLVPLSSAATGLRIRAQLPKCAIKMEEDGSLTQRGTLYVCSHRTLLDPIFISTALQRRVSAVTYSLSRFSEIISPIPTVPLTRDRYKDAATMRSLLDQGDLVVCPEGTTCREPYLLRFSPLFAELTDDIIPVAVTAEGSLFYGTSVRGYKWLDSLFFLMNPRPMYRMLFLDPTLSDNWKSSHEAANHIQRAIGRVLGFECTNLTRKDKYRMLAGNDGIVASGSR